MYGLPKLDVEKIPNITPEEKEIVSLILSTKGDSKGYVKSSFWSSKVKNSPIAGEAYYVWRHLVFFVSLHPQHQCMPVCDEMYIKPPLEKELIKKYGERWSFRNGTFDDLNIHMVSDERLAICKKLDNLVDRIMEQIPKERWYGVRRWGQALGTIG